MRELIDYINLLNQTEIDRIKNADEEYTFFDIGVSNVGAVARIEICNDIQPEWEELMDDENWNGYDAILLTEELQDILREI